MPIRTITVAVSGLAMLALTIVSLAGFGERAFAAACSAPSTDYGTVTRALSVPGTSTYRIWSRIMVPDSTNKTYLLEVDGAHCFNVGGGSIAPSTWVWVDYQSGATNNKTQLSLNQGNHNLKLIGNAPGVKVDRVLALSNLSCVPTGFGDNCNMPDDTAPPAVTLTAPLEGASVSGKVSLTASANDNTGVAKVEFYDNSNLLATDTSSPYGVAFDSATVPNGAHLITARAYDAAGNVSTDSSNITVKNGDSQAPSQPGNVKASASSYNTIQVTWGASTDNTEVTGYTVFRNGVPIDNTGKTTTYSSAGLAPGTSYTYQVLAFDAAGNKSALSAKATATTPTVLDTEAPGKPTGLAASAISQTQINLTWTAASDNIGVTAYDVYRSTAGGSAQKVGSSATTSYGDLNLTADTEYTYYVVARDASSNTGQPSDSVTTRTLTPPTQTLSSITGKITNSANGSPISYAYVTVTVDGKRHTYQADRFGRYAIFNFQTGRYNLNFRARGYSSQTIAVELTSTPLVQDVSLKKK